MEWLFLRPLPCLFLLLLSFGATISEHRVGSCRVLYHRQSLNLKQPGSLKMYEGKQKCVYVCI